MSEIIIKIKDSYEEGSEVVKIENELYIWKCLWNCPGTIVQRIMQNQ